MPPRGGRVSCSHRPPGRRHVERRSGLDSRLPVGRGRTGSLAAAIDGVHVRAVGRSSVGHRCRQGPRRGPPRRAGGARRFQHRPRPRRCRRREPDHRAQNHATDSRRASCRDRERLLARRSAFGGRPAGHRRAADGDVRQSRAVVARPCGHLAHRAATTPVRTRGPSCGPPTCSRSRQAPPALA